MALHAGIAVENGLLPVGSLTERGDLLVGERKRRARIGRSLVLDNGVFAGVQHVDLTGDVLDTVRKVVVDAPLSVLATPRRDQNDTVAAAGSVNRRSGGIFQHLDRFDVARVEVLDARNGHSVNDINRCRRAVGADTADVNLNIRSGLSGVRHDLYAGCLSGQRIVGTHDARRFEGRTLDRRDSSRHKAFLLNAVTHDHHFVNQLRIALQAHVDLHAVVYGHLLRLVSEEAEHQHIGFRRTDRISTLHIGRSAGSGAFDDDRHTGDAFARRIRHDTRNGALGLRRSRQQKQRAGQCQQHPAQPRENGSSV